MKVLQNLYYVYKIPSNKINNLKTYSFKDASRDGCVVSIGDNLVFAKIREYYGETGDHISLYNKVQDIRKEMKNIKKQPTCQENIDKLKDLQHQLDKMLFIDDIVNIKVITKKEYKQIARDGFDLNGKHYVRFMVGSGQMRRNTVSFINEELYDYMQEHLMCGLDKKIKNINLAKLSAYFALSFSSVLWVREPKVCVIKDFDTVIPNQKLNFIYKDDEEKNQVKEIYKDLKLNSCDGQGIISPEMAQNWAEDMHLNYVPCSFVVRTAFVKGNLVTFDFKEYARENGITKIKDRYGTEYNIDDIDVLLSESQFKMAKYYSAWEGYLSYHHSYHLKWGVARYNKEFDDEYVLTNYQYIQVLDLDREDIKGLVSYTTDWFKNICSGDKLYSLAYNIGIKNPEDSLSEIINSCGSAFTKAIVKNSKMLEDGYVQRKIYNSIKESIRQAKLGRIWVKGNYQFMISDPIAQVRNALGLSPDGELQANEVYSNFWNERNVSGEVCLMRSPLTHYSEINVERLAKTKEMEKWYKYIYSGVIYSIYDIATVKHADSDFDGDIVCSTNNEYFLKGAMRNEIPITYEKEMVPTQRVTLPNFIRCDVKGLDTKVGQITNYSTSMIAMLPLFKGEGQQEQLQEMQKRIKLLREIQGAEIDKIKGTTPPQFPREWRYWVKIDKDDDDITKAEKYKYNSMVVKKKPYFFIYLYSTLMKEYKAYEKNFNSISYKHFGMSIKDLLRKENRSEGENKLIRKYRKYSPVLETDCVMNNLCKEVESSDSDIKFHPSKISLLNEFADYSNIDEEKLVTLMDICKTYKSEKQFRGFSAMIENEGIADDDVAEIMNQVLYGHKDKYREKIKNLFSNTRELFNHLMMMCQRKNINHDIVWDIMGDDIIDIIPVCNPTVLIEDDYGVEYLGHKYQLQEVDNVSI